MKPSAAFLLVVSVLATLPPAARCADDPVHRVLFFSRSQGFEHSVIKEKDGQPSHVQTVLTRLAPANHVEFTFSKDGGIFTPENLARYDAFFFYTTGDLTQPGGDHNPPMTPDQKAALLGAIKNGKGFIGVHSASDTFHSHGDSVDPYIAMLGTEFIGHSAQQTSRITCTDPRFPGLGDTVKGLEMVEEWYSLKNFAPDLHVIFAQQTAGMKGWQYQRGSYPETFAHLYGKGRVFYSTLAHREDSWLKPEVQSVVLSGLHWVVGDTEADLTPNLAQTCPEANTLPVQPPPAPKSSATAPVPPNNTLTDAEKAAGWTLLFNGTDFTGWHNFKQEGVRPGWRVQDGAMVCADPHAAGDLVTTQAYTSFELELDYNIAPGGNSGIVYHVTDDGPHMWSTGPEFQLLDNEKGTDPQRCGWLYGLYQSPIDPATGKPLDATKPAGQWNHVRLLISRAKCEHDINGQKYLEYVLGSDDFKARVAKSKFGKMPGFAAATTGWIGLQGDHGSVSFRNVKIRPLPDDQ